MSLRGRDRPPRRCSGHYWRGTVCAGHAAARTEKNSDAQIRAVCSASGRSAHSEAQASGAAYATSDYHQVLDDKTIDTVIIATRHDLHAEIAVEALERGKHVFVEKPPAFEPDQQQTILKALEATPQLKFMVGYNRRFSGTRSVGKTRIGKIEIPVYDCISYQCGTD